MSKTDRELLNEIHDAVVNRTDERIIVEVHGGVAYCDDPRVEIIDYDYRQEVNDE